VWRGGRRGASRVKGGGEEDGIDGGVGIVPDGHASLGGGEFDGEKFHGKMLKS
jgi:hypothetical protein